MLILGIFILLIIIVLFIPLKIKIEAKLLEDLRVSIHISFAKLLKYNFILPMSKANKSKEKKKKLINFKIILSLLKFIIKKSKKSELYIDSDVGLDDAALTAQVVGAFYILSGYLITLVSKYTHLAKIKTNIKPSFSKFELKIIICCIAKTKIAHIIDAIIKLTRLYLKAKKGSNKK